MPYFSGWWLVLAFVLAVALPAWVAATLIAWMFGVLVPLAKLLHYVADR